MNPVFHTTPSGAGLSVSGTGPFGEQVLAALGGAGSGRPHLLAGVTQSGHLGLLDEIVGQAETRLLPWLPLVLDGPMLRCGPVAGRGYGPCPGCTAKRRRQHSPDARLLARLVVSGEQAFLPEHVPLAIALLHSVVHSFIHYGKSDEIHEADLVRGTFEKHRVVPVHACPRCDPPGRADRSWERVAVGLGSIAGAAG